MGTIFRRNLRSPKALESLRSQSIVPEARRLAMCDRETGEVLGDIWVVPRCSGKVWFVAYVEGRQMLRHLADFLALARYNGARLVEMHAATYGMERWAERHGWNAAGRGDYWRIV